MTDDGTPHGPGSPGSSTAGDPGAAVTAYTDDIEYDVVGVPTGPTRGVAGALEFYRQLVEDFRGENEERLRTYYGQDAVTLENMMTGVVTGQLLRFPGHGRRTSFRTLHVFEFRDGKVSRENVWLDGVAAQLTDTR
mgnify:CR=1 FL=1